MASHSDRARSGNRTPARRTSRSAQLRGTVIWHLLVAMAVLVAMVLLVSVAVTAPATPEGHGVGTLAGTHLFGRIVRTFSFFTVQSNLLVGATSAVLVARPACDGRLWRVARLDALVGIGITGIVYSTVLARVHEPHGWRETVANDLVHYAVPLAALLGWVLFGPRPRVTSAVLAWSLLWPVGWVAYTLIRGAVTRWYPYPFLDVATHGYARVLVNVVAVTVVLAAAAGLVGWGDRRLPAAPS